MIPSASEDRDVLAGEYVLGTLDPDVVREIEQALPADEDLGRRIAFWEAQLLPLADGLRPEVADPMIWARIERDVAELRDRRVASPRRRAVTRAWRSASLWRCTTALATAAAIVLAIIPGGLRPGPESTTRFFALMQTRDSFGAETGPGWLIQVASDGAVRSIPLANVEPGQGRSLQLWTLWDQARGPVSLGVLPPGGSVRLPPERLDVIGSGQLFEITLEPEHGSPTGRPTGRILFIGRASTPAVQAL
jgi:anti-sigma-K factor RskA